MLEHIIIWGILIEALTTIYITIFRLKEDEKQIKRKKYFEAAIVFITIFIEQATLQCIGECYTLMRYVVSCVDYSNKAEITLENDEFVLNVGQVQPILYSVYPASADEHQLIWQSDNPDVVLVQDGIVYARTVGIAVVCVSFKGLIMRQVRKIKIYVITAKDETNVGVQIMFSGLTTGKEDSEWYITFSIEEQRELHLVNAKVYVFELTGERSALASIYQEKDHISVVSYIKLTPGEKIIIQAAVITNGGDELRSEAEVIDVP